MALRPDITLQRSINAAIAGASNVTDDTDIPLNTTITGEALTAALTAVRDAIGSGFRFVARKDGSIFLKLLFASPMAISGYTLVLPTTFTTETILDTTLSGTLSGRIESASGTVYIDGTLGTSGTDFVFDANVVAADGVSVDSIVLTFNLTPSVPTDPGGGTPAGTTNTVNKIVADMVYPGQDFVLAGYEDQSVGWYVGGSVQIGAAANMSNSPQWWKDQFPTRWPMTCYALLPWLVIHYGPSHAATNTRVYIERMRCYYLRSTDNTWQSLGSSAGVSGYNTPKSSLFGGSEAEDKRTNVDGSVEILPPSNPNFRWHGWWNLGRVAIDPLIIRALHVTLRTKLVVDNGALADDRANAQYGIHVGADYYKDTATNWDIVAPGAGVSRVPRITNTLQAISFTTLTDVGFQDPGNSGLTEAQLRANPPPLD